MSGEIDGRVIEGRAEDGDKLFQLTLDIMVHRIRKYIGAYLLNLGGKLDAIVFTGGLGENWSSLRVQCMKDLERFGIEIDYEKNRKAIRQDRCNDVSTFLSQVRIFVIPTKEEKQIAKQTLRLINVD